MLSRTALAVLTKINAAEKEKGSFAGFALPGTSTARHSWKPEAGIRQRRDFQVPRNMGFVAAVPTRALIAATRPG